LQLGFLWPNGAAFLGSKLELFRGEGHDDAVRCANEAGGGWEDFGAGFCQLQCLAISKMRFLFGPFLFGHI